jgi:hypothetical protein
VHIAAGQSWRKGIRSNHVGWTARKASNENSEKRKHNRKRLWASLPPTNKQAKRHRCYYNNDNDCDRKSVGSGTENQRTNDERDCENNDWTEQQRRKVTRKSRFHAMHPKHLTRPG